MARAKDTLESWMGRYWWVVVFAIVIVSVVVVAYCSFNPEPITYMDFIEILGVTGSLLLTLVIAAIYNQLQGIEGEQLTIQEQQKELLQQNESPTLALDRWDVDENTVEFQLTNVGKGPALDISYAIEIVPMGEIESPDLSDAEEWPTYQLLRKTDSDEVGRHRTTLRSNSTGTFEAEVQVQTCESGSQLSMDNVSEPFTAAIETLLEDHDDAYSFNLKLGIQYESDIESVGTKHVGILDVIHSVDVYRNATLEEVLKRKPNGWMNPASSVLPDCVEMEHNEYFSSEDVDIDSG